MLKNTLIKADGTEEKLPDGQLTLEQMYKAIGCHVVELVRLSETRRLWCDEEGLLKSEPVVNVYATTLYQRAVDSPDVGIVGNAILEEGPETTQD